MEISKKDIDRIKEDIPEIIGNNIRHIRENKGLTQTQLAHLLVSDRQYLYKLEKGKVGLSVVKLLTISRALEIPVIKLLKGCE